jgi:hypothetical protein
MEPLPGASGSEGFLNAFSRSFTYLLKVKKATFMFEAAVRNPGNLGVITKSKTCRRLK